MSLIAHCLFLSQDVKCANYAPVNISQSRLLQALPELPVHDKALAAPKACC